MTTINVNTIAPSGSTLTVGESGDTIVAVDEIKVNTVKDAGGNTLWVSNGSGTLSSVSSGFGGALNLLSTQTASGSSAITFTSGIDSTYKEYIWKFININPATNATTFGFQVNASGETGYNETITSTYFRAYHQENDGGADGPGFQAAPSQDQGTALQNLIYSIGNASDEAGCGELHLFNPSSTTYAKNFYTVSNAYTTNGNDMSYQVFAAGYVNTTTAITQIEFKMTSGNFDGKIKMYGVS